MKFNFFKYFTIDLPDVHEQIEKGLISVDDLVKIHDEFFDFLNSNMFGHLDNYAANYNTETIKLIYQHIVNGEHKEKYRAALKENKIFLRPIECFEDIKKVKYLALMERMPKRLRPEDVEKAIFGYKLMVFNNEESVPQDTPQEVNIYLNSTGKEQLLSYKEEKKENEQLA